MNVYKNLLTLVPLFLITSFVSTAAELTAKQIIEKANLASYYAGDDGSAEARMKIVDAQGNSQIRQFTILRKDRQDGSDQDFLVFFSKPTDVEGTVFRVSKKVAADDDRWLYLPALDLVKRISASDKRTSFVGAHFFYEDVSGRNPEEDNFELQSKSADFYIIKGQPKDPKTVEFAYYIAQIDSQSFLPMTVSYFDASNKELRRMQVLKTAVIDGITTVLHSKISQLSDNSYTEMAFRNVKYNVGLPDDIFSERSLRTPPKAWLK